MAELAPSAHPTRVALFVTCLGDVFYPEAGKATVRVLRRLGVHVDFPQAQTCCGQPAFNAGLRRQARAVTRHQLDVLSPYDDVVVKGKSMATEEIQLNDHLEAQGYEVVETNLGEHIIQLAGEAPSHIIAPAIHKTRKQIAELLHDKLQTPYTKVIPEMTQIARRTGDIELS